MGATVFLPVGHSRNVDLVAEAHGRLLKIQVKTSTRRELTANGRERWSISLCTNGGNRSWSGVTKRSDPTKVDYLFVLVGDGRRWFIPAAASEGGRALRLGGTKYSEFEIEAARPILALVHGPQPGGTTIESPPQGERRSGRAGPDCKFGALVAEGVRIPPPPFQPRPGFEPSRYDRKLSRGGQAILNQKRRVTLPRAACIEAGFQDGDRLGVRSDGDGRVVLERIEPPPAGPAA
jgi:PD-(D/E)XK endonuclease